MYNDQPSLFDDPTEESPDSGRRIQEIEEVFALARECLGLSASGDDLVPPVLARARTRRLEKARELGLVVKWASYKKAKGHVSIHDPTIGEWHDLSWKDAPGWARWEARKRSDLYKATGDWGAFDLMASQMREIWEEDHPREEEKGIVEEYELPDD
jgi:hypothetical protein